MRSSSLQPVLPFETRLAIFLAWRDHRQRFATSVIGAGWGTLNLVLTSVVFGVVWGTLFRIPLSTQLPYTSSGLVAWSLIQSSLLEAPGHFSAARGLLLNTNFSSRVASINLLARVLVNTLFALPVPMIISLVFGQLTFSLLLLPVSLAVTVFMIYPYVRMLGFLGLRARDFEQFFPSVFLMIFMCTPIFFNRAQFGTNQWLVVFNPFYWCVDSVRGPLIGELPTLTHGLNFAVVSFLGYGALKLVARQEKYVKVLF